ncbi:ankyrin repeat-containing domain protein [Immersiella caudata]|uniref:Ankyrin repeat-containing domain protein n=1 Tax=Immersiella caudata TaxID=314043 RepID=A0AA39WXH2_9PEZI|nr:ankyrin repeat-containing domain protein [Immersiella caudata]
MDPFTVVGTLGATVNILEASVRLSHGLMQTIQSWKNAPDEILALNNTIAVFSVLLERVKETCLVMEQSDHDSGTARFHAVLDYQLRAAGSSLGKLSGYAEQLVVSRKAVQRTRWIKLRSAVKEETRRIREMHSTIDSILTSYIAGSVTQTHDAIQLVVTGIQSLKRRSSSASSLSTQTETKAEKSGQIMNRESFSLLSQGEGPGREPVAIHAQYLVARCSVGCPCQCHSNPGAPDLNLNPFGSLVGSLFVSYFGSLDGRHVECDKSTCRNRGRSYAEVTYIFPRWMMHYSLHVAVSKKATGGPTFGLILRRRVEARVGSTHFGVQSGNSALLKAALERDRESVNDVFFADGATALFVAVGFRRVDAVQILLAYGADANVHNDNGVSAGRAAALEVLAETAPPATLEQWRRLLPISRYIEELDLPHPTLIITEQRFGDLELALRGLPNWQSAINSYDRAGYTPVYWAARRGNAAAVRTLLRLGADVNTATVHNKLTPLMISLTSKNWRGCFQLLLRNGADPSRTDVYGRNAFHWACTNGRLAAVKQMLRAGMHVDDETVPWGFTGLMYAVSSVDVARFLLDHGADVNHRSPDDDTPLSLAMIYRSHDGLRLLLERGVDYSTIDHTDGSTVLHFAAVSDAETMSILGTHGLRGLDLSLKNKAGQTARQCFEARSDIDKGLREAFEMLLDSVVAANQTLHALPSDQDSEGEESESASDDAFSDALEYHVDMNGTTAQLPVQAAGN